MLAPPGRDPVNAARRASWQAGIVCLSVFGPYVTGPARTEQIVVFGLFAWVMVTGWRRLLNAPCGPAPFLVTWSGLYAVILISTAFRPFDPMDYGPQPPSHVLSAFLLPMALMTLTWYWSLAGPVPPLRTVATIVVWGMCANAVAGFAQLTAGKAAIGVLPHFWDAVPAAGSVAANAAENGRYTGIFDQPAEAGIAYGIAVLLLIWLARRGWKQVPVTCAATLLVTGGVLTLSKVFLLAALPAAAVTVVRGRARIRVLATAAAVTGASWLAGTAGLLPAWHLGSQVLDSLLHPHTSLTAQYTAGRYGSGGTLAPEFTDVLHNAAVAGFGAGGLNGPAYDSLWQQVLVVSGLAGVILAATVFVMLAGRLSELRRILGRPDWQLACGAAALAAAASLGIPSLTANRAGTLLWLVIGVLVTARAPARPEFRTGRGAECSAPGRYRSIRPGRPGAWAPWRSRLATSRPAVGPAPGARTRHRGAGRRRPSSRGARRYAGSAHGSSPL
jgi:hypothetical protein